MSQARPKWHFYAYLLNLIANKTALNTHINNTEIKLLQIHNLPTIKILYNILLHYYPNMYINLYSYPIGVN